MFTARVKTHFWASHQLALPDGSKEPVHSHNWTVTANVSSGKLNRMGLVTDFRRLKEIVDNIIADFDNTPLEKLDFFRRNNSSAENVAKYIYEKLEPRLPKNLKLNHIRVIEQPGCSAQFGKWYDPAAANF
ncbi:MAG: 6-pyruvoyl trahydropterin synthase family protein [Planctomycetota bacterium]